MKHEFDQFSDGYEDTVEQSVSFSGLKHDFFLEAKAHLLARVLAERFASPRTISVLDVGCGVGLFHPWLQPLVGQITGADPRLVLQGVVDLLAVDGIVLRDLARGLIDFPATSPGGRDYWLCRVNGEERVEWWHWPEDGFAGRRPLTEPPQ